MATVVVWKIPEEKWMADNHEGVQHLFDSEADAIQSAKDMERKKSNPDKVLVFKKDGSGMKSNIPIKKNKPIKDLEKLDKAYG